MAVIIPELTCSPELNTRQVSYTINPRAFSHATGGWHSGGQRNPIGLAVAD